MKKIIITTFQGAHNYGAFLQAFALQTKLQNMGYSVKILNYKKKYISEEAPYNFIKSNIKWTIKTAIDTVLHYKSKKRRYDSFVMDIKNNLELTEEIDNAEKFSKMLTNEILITGSDQVWNPLLTNGIDDVYFLNIPNNNVKISYAASLGNPHNIDNYLEKFKKVVKGIDKVSVREKNSEEYINSIINKKFSITVLDPTLLITKNQWNEIFKDGDLPNEEYIFAYQVTPNDDYYKVVNKISEETGLKVANFNNDIHFKNEVNCFTKGPFDFLMFLKNSKYVITTSFHATSFSIIFNKKFLVVTPKKNGNRITNLLSMVNLENRSLNSVDDLESINIDNNINYNEVNEILNMERIKSLDWLKNSIEKGK